MDKELKARWVKALRSGKYRQTTGSLRRAGRHCCLGVLCEIQDPTETQWGLDWGTPGKDLLGGMDNDTMMMLVEANDDHDWDFEDIATFVEVML